MDVASDRVNLVHAARLLIVKDMRERAARSDLSNAQAKCRIAALAAEQALSDLAIAEEHRARIEAELYQLVLSPDSLSVAAFDRLHIALEPLAAEIALRRGKVSDARTAQQQTEAALSEMRARWAKCSAATSKWQQIEDDVRSALDAHSELAVEIDSDDELLLRYARGAQPHVAAEPS
ncbi:hypothetical protein Q2941_10975 [Bradyrhizobium sp. UFLA05-153]